MLFYCVERLIFQGLQRIIYLRSLSKYHDKFQAIATLPTKFPLPFNMKPSA